jgi:nucleolin
MDLDKKNKKRKADEPEVDNKKTKVTTPDKSAAPQTNGEDSGEYKVFIGNLSFNIDEATVKEVFADCGQVTEVFFLMDKATNRFKGTGFVSFTSAEAQQKALNHNGESVMDREIRVEIATPRPGGPRKSPGPRSYEPSGNPPSRTVFLGNLPLEINEEQIKDTFKDCGEVESIRWVTNRETGEFRCCGFVDFDSEDCAAKAVELSGTEIGGKSVRIDFAGEKKAGGDGGGRGGFGGGRGGFGGGRGGGGFGGRGGGRGGFGGGRGGRGGFPPSKNSGAIRESEGKRITFD